MFLSVCFLKLQPGLWVSTCNWQLLWCQPVVQRLVQSSPISVSPLGQVGFHPCLSKASSSSPRNLKRSTTANVLVLQLRRRRGQFDSLGEKTGALWVLWLQNLSLQMPEFLVLRPHCPLGFFTQVCQEHLTHQKPSGELIIYPPPLYSLCFIPYFAIHPGKMNAFSLSPDNLASKRSLSPLSVSPSHPYQARQHPPSCCHQLHLHSGPPGSAFSQSSKYVLST